MKKIATTLAAGLIATAVVTLGPAPSATAAAGDYTCGGLYAPRLVSDTLGNTVHRWTNNNTAATKKIEWPSGGVHASVGYAGASNHWVLNAPTVYSYSVTCVN